MLLMFWLVISKDDPIREKITVIDVIGIYRACVGILSGTIKSRSNLLFDRFL